jgi:hypothetical protein
MGFLFSEDIPAGRHNIQVSFVSYETVIIEGVIVEDDKTTFVDVALEEASLAIEGVEITARSVTHTEMSVISAIRASNVVASGISLTADQQVTGQRCGSGCKKDPRCYPC